MACEVFFSLQVARFGHFRALFGDPAIFAEIFPLSHELGELLTDPLVNNVTPNYQLAGLLPGRPPEQPRGGRLNRNAAQTHCNRSLCTARRVTLKPWALAVVRGRRSIGRV
jgi:hypothetical protein